MTKNDVDISDLSEATELELGGENLKAVIAVDSAGNIKLFKPRRAITTDLTVQEKSFPIVTENISNIIAGCIVAHRASPTCITIVIGGMKFKIC
jgi:hypothetical protein